MGSWQEQMHTSSPCWAGRRRRGSQFRLPSRSDSTLSRLAALFLSFHLSSAFPSILRKRQGAARQRMTEREEDELMQKELDSRTSAEDLAFTRLTKQPSTLSGGKLRDYQLEGLNWLIGLHHR